jgi:dolichol-phosphate mannosyltransferase
MMGQGSSVFIVIPTLNEAGNVVPLLERVRQAMSGIRYFVCIVDDGSKDGTLNRVRDWVNREKETNVHILRREKTHWGSQRGVAVWTGLRYGLERSGCEMFVEMDADLSHRPEELEIGITAIRDAGYNVAIASKYLSGSRVLNRPVSRRVLSFVLNSVVRSLIRRSVTDYSNGYRFYDRSSVELICAHRLRYGSPIYLSEILALLLAHQMRIVEFASTYVGRGEGLSKLRVIDLLKAGVAVLDIATRFHFHLHGFVRGEPSFSPVRIQHIEPALQIDPPPDMR